MEAFNDHNRIIYHVDCNGFFASVEELFEPELKKVPMAICGDPENRRGIILAKNELAKGFGIKTAETIWEAKRKCPELALRPPRHDAYGYYCEKVNSIYEQYTDLVERFGIDESYLDVTNSLHLFGGDAENLAHEIRKRVTAETGLTVSVGVSYNKIFAKLGSDYKKPDAVTVVSHENYKKIIWPLPVSDLLFVGKSTGGELAKCGIDTIGELANADEEWLLRKFGKHGTQLHLYANGLDNSPVAEAGCGRDIKSVGNGITFKRDLVSREDIKTAIIAISDTVAGRLRRYGFMCMTVQITIKDSYLKVITRQKATKSPTHLASEISQTAMELIETSWTIGKPIRLLTVTAQKLVPPGQTAEQLSLFDEPSNSSNNEKHEKLEHAMDKIRGKYGKGSIHPGSILKNDLGINE